MTPITATTEAATPVTIGAPAPAKTDTEARPATPTHHINSVDATVGQPMLARVTTRKEELEALRASLPETDVKRRRELDQVIAAIASLMTGDLTKIPSVVARDMNNWLERNKHLGG